jgi:hypothetical protein
MNVEEPMDQPHIDRYIPADTNAGWPFAMAVVAFAIACIVTVTIIHRNTYKHPTDVTWHGKGSGDEPSLSPVAHAGPAH